MSEPAGYIEQLDRLRELGLFSPSDRHFARFLIRMLGREDYPLELAATLLCRATVTDKHVCFDLSRPVLSLSECFPDLTAFAPEVRVELAGLLRRLTVPERWMEVLLGNGVVGGPGDYAPLILHGSLLYLQRYWRYEQLLARRIRELTGLVREAEPPSGRLLTVSRRFTAFAAEHPGEVNFQAVAAFSALRHRLAVITGGPGTGKTTVVAAFLALYLELYPDARPALCAPTGKAQARLGQALRGELPHLDAAPEVMARLAAMECSTIHRLLGVIAGTPHFRHDRNNPLDVDLVIVDEASMVPLGLMTRLFEALPAEAGIVLLGDRDQLASVEAGAVLANLCASGDGTVFSAGFAAALLRAAGNDVMAALPVSGSAGDRDDRVVELRRNYRFAPDRGIARVKDAICALGSAPSGAHAEDVLRLLQHDPTGEVSGTALPDYADGSLDRAIAGLAKEQQVESGRRFRDYLRAESLDEAFRLFDGFRILCSHRGGPYGSDHLNRLMEKALHLDGRERFYAGMPVMIVENDYLLRLFNGDVGLIRPDPESGGALRAFFPDYAAGPGAYRSFSPYQLPPFEKVFAMTVHKSQGSGFGRVLLLIPDLDNSPILTRELIYTGITRAMQRVEVWYRPRSLRAALMRQTERTSDLCRAIVDGSEDAPAAPPDDGAAW